MVTSPTLRDMRQDLCTADDDKIRRIVALMDRQSMPEAARAILDPLRPRLAVLRPPRPLRFARLLFMPLDPVIVPARDWRPTDATLPRGVLLPIAAIVRAGLGAEALEIDALIADRDTTDEPTIANAGPLLWTRAADILAAEPEPLEWDATGLPPAVYPPLARAIAAVLRRAVPLRDLMRDAALGALNNTDASISGILGGLAAESPDAYSMAVAILLVQLPHAASKIQRLIASNRGTAASAMLRQAMDRGVDGILTAFEAETGFDADVRGVPLRDAGQEVQRIATLLSDIDNEPDTARHRPRLKSIRLKLDQTCRARFDDGLTEGLITPLSTAAEPLSGAAQSGIETKMRGLRALESAGRKIGGAATYDARLEQAVAATKAAANNGVLTPVRHMRLVEILAGPEAADALYRQGS